jgi:hypothetical protein
MGSRSSKPESSPQTPPLALSPLLQSARDLGTTAISAFSFSTPFSVAPISVEKPPEYNLLVALLCQVRELPRAPLESIEIEVIHCGGTDSLGQIVAARTPSIEDITLHLPQSARPGFDMSCTFKMTADFVRQYSSDELRLSLASIATHAQVDVMLTPDDLSGPYPLVATSHLVDLPNNCVHVTFRIPVMEASDANVIITSATIAGKPVTTELPLHIPLRRGMSVPPVSISACGGPYSTVAVSAAGLIYSVSHSEKAIRVYNFDGARITELPLSDYGIFEDVRAVAVCEATQTLVFGGRERGSRDSATRVVAIDLVSYALRWATPHVSGMILGLAVLERAGLVIVAVANASCVSAFRASDGVIVSRLTLSYPINVATDPITEEIIVGGASEVTSVVWTGSELKSRGELRGLTKATNQLLLTVIPPAPGHVHSHLLVLSYGASQFDVVSLPNHKVVHKGFILPPGVSVNGFMTDRWGSALGVVDHFTTKVLRWPLEGLTSLK